MWPSESDLEPLDSIIDRMHPIAGFPYPMKSAINQGFPRNAGDPWIGAYTKNGYWFKLSWGGEQEWKEIANEMWYRNELLVDSSSFNLYQRASENSGKLLVAKNIRGDVLGCSLLSVNQEIFTIGPIFVQEDFRHVGIGTILMKMVMKEGKEIGFNAISYLHPEKFKLEPRSMRGFGRFRVKNPSGFEALKEGKIGVQFLPGLEISPEQWSKIESFGESCTNEKRNWKAFSEDSNSFSQFFAAFDTNSGECVGFSVLREIQNEDGRIPDLLMAPLYAKTTIIAEVLMRKLLKKFYNPKHDYDFDVDHSAIYRRSVNFFVFSASESVMIPVLKKLAGTDGKVEKDRLTYQTCSNFQLPAINHNLIFALSDPNTHFC